jgi:pilus assembly protein CpaB
MTGVAGFVFPGDRVDLVLTQTVSGEDGPDLRAAETVIRNLRVLATDQTTETTTDENGKTVVTAFRTVTLEVTPKIAEKVAVAQTIGTLSLALRSLADNDAELERAIAAGDISIPDNATPEQEEKLLKAAMARPIDKGTTFVTGGDVSRFQRKSMPEQDGRRRGSDYTPPSPGVSAKVDSQPVYRGPSVRVTRGKATQEVPVSPQASASGMVRGQADAMRRAGQTVPVASSTLVY